MTDLAKFLRSRPHLAADNPSLFDMAGVVASRRKPKIKTSLWRDETAMCRSFDERVKGMCAINPLYALLYHIPNENSHRNPGVRGGVPDYHLPVAKPYIDPDSGLLRCYHGLWLEFKTADGDLRTDQEWWIQALREQGHFVDVIWENIDNAFRVIDWYLEDDHA